MAQNSPKAFANLQQKQWFKLALRAILILFFIVAGLGIGILIGTIDKANEAPVADKPKLEMWVVPMLVLLSFISMFLVIAIHEIGHLIGGAISGFRFYMFVLGPLLIVREQDQKVYIRLNKLTHLAGGAALSLPRNGVATPSALFNMIAGGPLTSVIFGVVLLGFYYLFPKSYLPQLNAGWAFILPLIWLIMGVGSILIGITTLIPSRMGIMQSDGFRLLNLMRKNRTAEYDVAMVGLLGAVQQGARPAQWPITDLETLMAQEDETTLMTEGILAHFYAYYVYLDTDKITQAGNALKKILNSPNLHKLLRPNICLEYAYYVAVYEKDAVTARKWYNLTHGQRVEPRTKMRAEAAVLFAENKPSECQAILEKLKLQLAKPNVPKTTAEYEHKLIAPLQANASLG